MFVDLPPGNPGNPDTNPSGACPGEKSRGGPSIETGSPRGRFWREQVANLNVGYVVARENYCHVARNGFCAT